MLAGWFWTGVRGLAWEGECESWGGGGCCMMSWGCCQAPGDLIGALGAAHALGAALGALSPLEGAGCAHAPVAGDHPGLEREVGGSTHHCLGCSQACSVAPLEDMAGAS